MDLYNLNYIEFFGILTCGVGIMMCLFQCPIRKRAYNDIEEKPLNNTKNSTTNNQSSPTKRLRSMSSMEKLNVFFDIEENKNKPNNTIKSKSTHNILNEKEFEIENIRTNFDKYKLQCGICKSLIASFKEVYCYMDNKFCSENCREHYYKIQNDNYKRRFSL